MDRLSLDSAQGGGETLVCRLTPSGRIDVQLGCSPIGGSGNIQAKLADKQVVAADGSPFEDAITGATIGKVSETIGRATADLEALQTSMDVCAQKLE